MFKDGIPVAAKANVETVDEGVPEDEFGAKDYRKQMILKADHENRPLWVVSIPLMKTETSAPYSIINKKSNIQQNGKQ